LGAVNGLTKEELMLGLRDATNVGVAIGEKVVGLSTEVVGAAIGDHRLMERGRRLDGSGTRRLQILEGEVRSARRQVKTRAKQLETRGKRAVTSARRGATSTRRKATTRKPAAKRTSTGSRVAAKRPTSKRRRSTRSKASARRR